VVTCEAMAVCISAVFLMAAIIGYSSIFSIMQFISLPPLFDLRIPLGYHALLVIIL
jgi:hypothetical protein